MAGIGRYWILVELCAEKLRKEPNQEYSLEDCNFVFDAFALTQSLGYGNLKQALSYLHAIAELGMCSISDDGETVLCSMPNLLESMDRDTKRARTERVTTAPKKKRKNKEEEKEIDKEFARETVARAPDFDFESLYKKYPRKLGKAQALITLKKTVKTQEQFQDLSQAISNYADHCSKQGTEERFIKHFSSFIGPVDKPHWRDWVNYQGVKLEKPKYDYSFLEDVK